MFIHAISPYISDIESIDLTEEAIKLMTNNNALQSLTNKLEKYKNQIFSKVKFNQVFSEWGKKNGYYGWKGVRYFLFEYELFLKNKTKTSREKLIWDEFTQEDYSSDHSTIEHIYPRKVAFDCWKVPFKDYSLTERNILKNSVGNLVPLSRPKNSSLGNKCFDAKKGDDTNKVGYIYGCYSENEIAQEKQWTAREILLRGIKLLEFMETRWGISLGSKKDKVKALSLDFVLSKEKITL